MKLKTKVRRPAALILALAVILGLANYEITDVRAAGDAVSGAYLLSDYTLSKGGSQLQMGSTIYAADDLQVQYLLRDLLVDTIGNNTNVAAGTVYQFIVPGGLLVQNTTDWQVLFTMGETDYPLGTAHYNNTDKAIELTLTEGIFGGAYESILDSHVTFNAKLDPVAFGNGNAAQSLAFGFGSTPNFSFTYGDNVQTDTTISKSGAYDPVSNKITWTVIVTDGNINYTGNLKLEDTYSANQSYVADSFTMDTVQKTPVVSTDDTTGITTIYYAYTPAVPSVPGTPHTITYQTVFNDRAYVDNTGKVVSSTAFSGSNSAKLYDEANNKLISEDMAEVGNGSTGSVTWMSKSASRTYDPVLDEQVTTWTITIDTNGFSFNDLVLYDAGISNPVNSESKYIVNTGSLNVIRNSGSGTTLYDAKKQVSMSMVSTGADGSAKITTGDNAGNADGSGRFNWQLQLDEGGANGVYTITYDSKITNYSKYVLYNQTPTKNDAHLTFEWPDFYGPGHGRSVSTPVLGKSVDAISGQAMIGKAAGVYDPTTHQIKWHITINRDKQAGMDGIYLEETILGATERRNPGDLEQEFVEVSGLKINGSSASIAQSDKLAYRENEGVVTIEFNEGGGTTLLEGNCVELDVITRLTDADYYENNIDADSDRRCFNTVTMKNSTGSLSYADATAYPQMEVIKKSAGTYDYAAHEMKWSLTVNSSKVPMQGVSVEDKILAGDFRPASSNLCVDGNPISSDATQDMYYSYQSGSKTLTIYMKDSAGNELKNTHTVTYSTFLSQGDVISDAGIDKTLATYNGDITLSNTASLHKKSSNSVPTSSASKVISNQVAGKSVKDSGEKNTALYTINLNQPQNGWKDGLVLTDIMSPGMNLNLASVALYEATVQADGTLTYTEANRVNKNAYTRTVTILQAGNAEGVAAGSTRFQFTLPTDSNSKAYVLTYRASKDENTSATDFTNTIAVPGVTGDGSVSATNVSAATLNGYGGGKAVSKSRVAVYKQSKAQGNVPLQGAKFALQYEGQTIAIAETQADGRCIFTDLVPGETYTIEEVAALSGYLLGTGSEVKQSFQAVPYGDTTLILGNPLIFRDAKEGVSSITLLTCYYAGDGTTKRLAVVGIKN